MRIIGKILVGILASLGLSVLVLSGFSIYFLMNTDGLSNQATAPPENMILSLNLDAGFSEGRSGPNLTSFGVAGRASLQDAVIALRRAGTDDRVQAVVANVSGQSLGLAQVQEIRDAVAVFRESGKPALLYTDTLGELGNATTTYYLATAFEEIWLQPSGGVGLTGLAIEQPFLKGFLDKLGIRANALQRYEYKSAAENFTNTEMSEPNKEALDALFGSIFEQLVDGIAEARGISTNDVEKLMAEGPLLAQEAMDGGLVDHLAYRDEFNTRVDDAVEDGKRVSVRRYLNYGLPEETKEAERSVALIHAVGTIGRGKSDDSPFGGEGNIGADTLAKAVRDAAEDEDVDAILLRVDSPGGSYVASDTIWREVIRAKETGKPFIVSMGNTAASGGYFIAMPADKIYAQPGTITGSIGVIINKVVFEGALEKLDINWSTLTYGENGDIFTPSRDFNEAELARMNRTLDAIYDDFTTKAAAGRDMSVAEMREIAKGRVWSGADAKRIGLVDELGGLSDAIDHTKVAIGLTSDDLVRLVPYPKRKDPFESILDALEDGTLPFGLRSAIESLVTLTRTINTWVTPYARGPEAAVLYAPPLVIR
ncbi:MAG: signal peptide peptidase SppA [Rhodospirillaceae bacterium]|jgi:protease IV|nr:signal peptide peptidase SppA [Rhodospirillaceae bacterium]MBT6091135.1 signal peptide peptidase SppA [Rhodospirillaceae bacterium]MBT6961308.1 signal peptide peptidase SppA [Rhodospirillaceae bacterium]MBT7452040.1 signal peptide peptidase SppA [Rhodospirillaceae bacterium]